MRLHFTNFDTPDHCLLTPCLSVTTFRCENPGCEEPHAYALELQWLWWGIAVGLDM